MNTLTHLEIHSTLPTYWTPDKSSKHILNYMVGKVCVGCTYPIYTESDYHWHIALPFSSGLPNKENRGDEKNLEDAKAAVEKKFAKILEDMQFIPKKFR